MFFFAVLLIASGFSCNYEIMLLWNTYRQLGILIPNHHMKLQIFFTHACFTAAQHNWMIPREVLQRYNWNFAKSSTVDASLNNWSKLFTGIWEDDWLSSRPYKIPTLFLRLSWSSWFVKDFNSSFFLLREWQVIHNIKWWHCELRKRQERETKVDNTMM
jgi:hypothetical protein